MMNKILFKRSLIFLRVLLLLVGIFFSNTAFAIDKLDQTITFPALAGKIYSDADFEISATAESNLPVSFTSITLEICTLNGVTVHIISSGSCTITASQAGDDIYNPAPSLNQTAYIDKAVINITADTKSKVVGSVDPVLTYTNDPLVTGDEFSGVLSREIGEDIGAYSITQGTLALNNNYTINFTGADFIINYTPPIIASHDDIIAPATQRTSISSFWAVVDYIAPDTTSDIDGITPAICTPETHSKFHSGINIITCEKTDSSGNSAVPTTFKITVVDTPPVITLLGASTINLTVGSVYSDEGATALDYFDGDITESISTSNHVDTNVIGTYLVTYDVMDINGNAATQVVRTVNVTPITVYGGGSLPIYITPPPISEPIPTPTPVAEILSTPIENPTGEVLGVEKFIFTLYLKKGPPYNVRIQGNEVMELQKFLNLSPYDSGLVVDGKFGPLTEAAVIKFQLANDLIGDGIVGASTRAVLNK
ncbi:MAG: immunoglobulin-like domain-containing protein [Candidatus Paceibacterota bacterium]|jgi:hypothetical protein